MSAVFFLHFAVELSSASEDDMDSDDSEQGEKGQTCSHCLTTSKYIPSVSTNWCYVLLHVAVDHVVSVCYFLILVLLHINACSFFIQRAVSCIYTWKKYFSKKNI